MAFPVVAGLVFSVDNTSDTNHVIDLPGSIVSGNLLIVGFCNTTLDSTPNAAIPDFTLLGTRNIPNAQGHLSIFYKIADGSEGATVTGTTDLAEVCAAFAMRVTGFDVTTPIEISTGISGISSSTVDPDPASLTPSWGAKDTLWIAVCYGDEPGTDIDGFPSNYPDNNNYIKANNVAIGIATLNENTATSDPDPFSLDVNNRRWACFTLAVQPGASNVEINAGTVDLPLVPITLSGAIEASIGTVDLPIVTVVVTVDLETNSTAIDLVISAVTATLGGSSVNPDPAILTLEAVAVFQEINVNTESLNLNIFHSSEFDPQILIEHNEIPIDLVLSLAVNTNSVELSTEPIDLVISLVTPTFPLNRNVEVLELVLSAITVTISGGRLPTTVVVTIPEPIEAKSNIFAAFSERLKFVNPIVSEYVLEDTKFPYISLGQVYNILNWKNSCLERFEEGQYALKIYTESYIELEDRIKVIENTLIYDTLLLADPKKLISLEQVHKETEEIRRELYCCTLVYETIIQKQINTTYITSLTAGETLNKCIYERSKLIKHAIGDFVSPGYALENTKLPYITVPKISEELSWLNTKGRIDEVKYPITIKSEDLNELLEIMDQVESVFDYAKFNIDNKKHLINEWVGTEIIEIEPQLWCGKVNYEILVESGINEYVNNES